MNRRAVLVGLSGLPLLAPPPARAQTVVYRCGPEGRSFEQRPCRDGVAMTLEAGPDAQARREALAVAEREARLARRLVEERQAREAASLGNPHAMHRPRRRSAGVGDVTGDVRRRTPRAPATEQSPRESRRARAPRTPVAARPSTPSGG